MLVKGELEKLGTPKGLPNLVDLFNTILDQGGTVIMCELANEAKHIKLEDLRDRQSHRDQECSLIPAAGRRRDDDVVVLSRNGMVFYRAIAHE